MTNREPDAILGSERSSIKDYKRPVTLIITNIDIRLGAYKCPALKSGLATDRLYQHILYLDSDSTIVNGKPLT